MFNSYIPPLIQESICEAGEKDNEICEIGVFHPLCLQNKVSLLTRFFWGDFLFNQNTYLIFLSNIT